MKNKQAYIRICISKLLIREWAGNTCSKNRAEHSGFYWKKEKNKFRCLRKNYFENILFLYNKRLFVNILMLAL